MLKDVFELVRFGAICGKAEPVPRLQQQRHQEASLLRKDECCSTTSVSTPNFDQSSLGSDDSGICCSLSSSSCTSSTDQQKLGRRLTRSAELLVDDDAHLDESKSIESDEMESEEAPATAPESPLPPPESPTAPAPVDGDDRDSGAALSPPTVGGGSAPAGAKQSSWLLRWFECKLFDMSYAITYLFNSKEAGVQTYIGNRMFGFPQSDVDFYLQQVLIDSLIDHK